MKKKYLVYGAIATIGAVLFYLWKKGKDDQDKEDKEKTDVNNGTPKSEDASKNNTSNLGSSTQNTGGGSKNPDSVDRKDWDKPTGFDKATGNKFRNWFNDNYPKEAKAFKLDREGEPDNSYIRLVYWKYKSEWNKYLGTGSTSSTNTGSSSEVLLSVNQNMVSRLAKAWGLKTSYYQLSGAPTGTMALSAVGNFTGANSKGVKRYYKLYLYAQESASTKKAFWRIEEYTLSTLGYKGNFIGYWAGYLLSLGSNGVLSFSETQGQNKFAKETATNANEFIKKTTKATSYGWVGY